MRHRTAPVIPGWVTSIQAPSDAYPDGRLKATRVEGLSDYQQEYGCKRDVFAQTGAELEVLTVAEIVHAAMVAKAEQHSEALQRVEEMMNGA